jgi:hypothetical protein
MRGMKVYRRIPWVLSAIVAFASLQALAQHAVASSVADAQPKSGSLSLTDLEKLVAPVALYPDSVLTDILAASTYPAEVVEAQRFLADPANNGLQGAALASAVEGHDWDPSVVALIQFPPVLQMMDGQLEWTEHLGRAFMAQQADVMNAVQHLRQLAEAAGTLKNGPREDVVNDGGIIAIDPASNQGVYLPIYDPSCVYGPAPGCDAADDELGWDDGIYLPYGSMQWAALDWPGRLIRLQRGGGNYHHFANSNGGIGGIWHHSVPHVFAASHPFGGDDGYLYAPPATQPLFNHTTFQHAVGPAQLVHAGGYRPVVQHAETRSFGVAHGGGRR